MKKHLMIGALALSALTAVPAVAEAQQWRGDRDRYERRDDRRDYRRDRRDDRREERWDRREDRRDARWDRRDDRRDYRRWERDQRRDYRAYQRWQRGAVIPYNYRNQWYVNDYRRYGYAPPPRGYGYYRTDTGDVVLALIATGVVLSLLD